MEKHKTLLIDDDVEKSRGNPDLFKDVVVASNEAIAVSEPGGRLIYVNPAHEKLFGRSLEVARSLSYWDYYSEKSVEKYHQEILPAVKRGETWEGLIEVLDSKGKHFSIWQRTYATYDEKRKIQYCFTLQHKFKERNAEKNLRKTQQAQAIGTLAGGIAHEFNNILWIIMANTELAAGNLPEGNTAQKNLQRVEKACSRGADLVQQILSFSRQDEHRPRPVDIMPITKELLKFLRSSIPTTIEIRQNISTQSATIMADPSQMHQTLINLCTNAVDAMGEKPGVLEVSMTDVELDQDDAVLHDLAPGKYIRLSVKDTGMGMEPEVLERIFEPFFTTKDVGKGRGMGLAVIHGMVKNCEGSIEVHSEPGKGSTFHLFFPKIEKERKSGSGTLIPSAEVNGRILFVDDDKEIANTGKEMLEGYGYQVESKTCSEEALKTFRDRPDRFDLVIADMIMPKMTGEALAEKIMRIRPDIPIILCTGYDEGIYKERARKIGIKAVMMKPVTGRGLVNAIKKALREEV
jgi:signal transduction histidine kinase/CheY-like chemotaxis protein